jgi:uncharacterized glyoxalase superfamily protein PhnB
MSPHGSAAMLRDGGFMKSVTAMIHVADVRATVAWYQALGFTVAGTYEDDDDMSWARLSFGSGTLMINAGGLSSDSHRRDVDLYVETDDVTALYFTMKERVEMLDHLHDTFYGMREFTIRDINRFWITFAEPIGT